MFGNKLINTNAGGGGCVSTVDNYNPFPDGGGVALYQLNGNANDVSTNYDGADSNVTWGGAGVFGTSAAFNGSSSYIYNNVLDTSTTKAVSIWAKPNDFNERWAFQQGDGQGVENYIRFYNIDDIQVRIGNVTQTFSGYSANTWYHIVAQTNTSGNANVWINGVEVGTSTAPTALTVNRTNIGARYNTGFGYQNYFNGSIDQVRIFNRALRPYEVEALQTEVYCTPTIVPSEHFNTVLYTAATTNGTYDITGSSFQPDFIWVKNRDNVEQHYLMDSVRGLTNMTDKFLQSSTTNSESSASAQVNGTTVTAIQGGFRVVETTINSGEFYFNGRTYVSWNFKAGGAAVTNTDGTITSQVSANVEAGFSVVKVNTNSNGTIGHGLGKKPSIIFTKNLSRTQPWWTSVDGITGNQDDYLTLETTSAVANIGAAYPFGRATDTVFSSSTAFINNGDVIAYCFAEVEGFSSFGSYVGTGASGNSVVTGFEPAFVMIKRATGGTGDWNMWDNKRGNQSIVWANGANAEATNAAYEVAFNENGFTINATANFYNGSGDTYIYMAFAADPTAVEPTLADSFNTATYTGNGTTNPITGVGFQSDLVWIKIRDVASSHVLIDSNRGVQKYLNSNTANQEATSTDQFTSFDTDGFTLGANAGAGGNTNQNGNNYVAWNWKGAELPAINSNGSIKSVVSANPAAGFSIVSYTGNGIATGQSFGHGLAESPNMIIVKNRTTAGTGWDVLFPEFMTSGQYMALNLTSGIANSANSGWGGSLPDNSKVFVGGSSWTNTNGDSYIAYCFAEVAGFSKFGSYTGNGSTQTIVTGFEPAFVMMKSSSTATNGYWVIIDNKRSPSNPRDNELFPNDSAAEYEGNRNINFLSNGFELTSSSYNNDNGTTYIYMAFANQF